MKFKRVAAGCALALSALGLSSAAHAAYNGKLLTGDKVPVWAVGNFSCQGTLILPRVVISAEHCPVDDGRTGYFRRHDQHFVAGVSVGMPVRYGPLGDVRVTLLDQPLAETAANVPSYMRERRALSWGASLSIYARNHATYDGFRNSALKVTSFRDLDGWDAVGHPLVYRHVQGIRRKQLPNITSDGSPIFNANLRELMFGSNRPMTDQDVNEAVIVLVPDASAGSTIRPPIFAGDSGSGLFVQSLLGQEWFVGVASGHQAHSRVSQHWPWVYDMLLKHGARAEALALAKRVLNPWERSALRQRARMGELAAALAPDRMKFDEFDRKGQVGSIFPYENIGSGTVEFYRLVQLDAQGRYRDLPSDSRDGAGWEYLGTKLPTREEAVAIPSTWIEGDDSASVGDIFVQVDAGTGEVDYFQLASLDSDERYGPLPTNRKSSTQWTYLGTDLPTRVVNFPS